MCIAFVDEPGSIEIDGRGVVITYKSGGDVFVRRMALRDFRLFMVDAARKLRAFDERKAEVLAFPKKKRAKHA